MAYLHCHTKDCGWSQDDFWTLRFRIKYIKWQKKWWKKFKLDIGYNPISETLDNIKWLWKPRWVSLEKWLIDDLVEYTGVNVKVKEVEMTVDSTIYHSYQKPLPYKLKTYEVFSWDWLRLEFVKEWKNFKEMKWWTYKSWKKARDTAVCPKCGLRNFDID